VALTGSSRGQEFVPTWAPARTIKPCMRMTYNCTTNLEARTCLDSRSLRNEPSTFRVHPGSEFKNLFTASSGEHVSNQRGSPRGRLRPLLGCFGTAIRVILNQVPKSRPESVLLYAGTWEVGTKSREKCYLLGEASRAVPKRCSAGNLTVSPGECKKGPFAGGFWRIIDRGHIPGTDEIESETQARGRGDSACW